MKKVLLTALTFIAIACTNQMSQTQTHNKCVKPLESSIDIKNIKDAIVPAMFTTDDFKWMEGNLKMTVFSEDLYDAFDISSMSPGDTLLWNNNTIIVKENERQGDLRIINKGLEEGGADLISNEGGTFKAVLMDDHSVYSKLGQIEIPLAENFTIIDCGENPSDSSDTIRENHKLYLENLAESRRSFNNINTKVTIENGVITNITRRWIP